MLEKAENSLKWLKMAGEYWEKAGIAGYGYKWLEMAGNGWNGQKQLDIAGNGWKWL